MDTKLFFILLLLLVDQGSPFSAEHPESGGRNAVENFQKNSRNEVENNGVNRDILVLEAHERPRRQTSVLALPGTILGGIFDSSMGMLGGVMQYFLPGSNALVKLFESIAMKFINMMARPILFTARTLGEPIDRMANNMLDTSKELAVKYSMKMAGWCLNQIKRLLPMFDAWAVEYAKNPDISDNLRNALNTGHTVYRMMTMFGVLKVT